PFVASAGAESSPDLLEVVTPADNENRRCTPCLADVIQPSAFVSLTVHGIDDDERGAGSEARVYISRHPHVRLVAHTVVRLDVDREPPCELHPFAEHDSEFLVDVAASDQHTSQLSVETHRGRGLAGSWQSGHHDDSRR